MATVVGKMQIQECDKSTFSHRGNGGAENPRTLY